MIKMKLIQKFLPKGYLVTNLCITNLYEKSIYKQNFTTTRIKTVTFQL